jgi:hypothetical protein
MTIKNNGSTTLNWAAGMSPNGNGSVWCHSSVYNDTSPIAPGASRNITVLAVDPGTYGTVVGSNTCIMRVYDSYNYYGNYADASFTYNITGASMSGAITGSDCTITSGASSCTTTLAWATANPEATSSVTSSYPSAGTTVFSGNSGGPNTVAIPYNARAFYLYNNNKLLFTKAIVATCVAGTVWSGGLCRTSTFSIIPSSKTIQLGQTATFSASYDPDGNGAQAAQDVTSTTTWGPADTADCGAVSNAVVTKVGNGQYQSVAVGNACIQAAYAGLGGAAGITVTNASTLPTVTTATPVTSITQTTATGGGNVTSNGGATVTVSGLVWSTSANPTYAGGGPGPGQTTNGWADPGNWTSGITGLTTSTLYHVRAYAVNSVGTAYGNDVPFTTLGPAPVDGVLGCASGHVFPNGTTDYGSCPQCSQGTPSNSGAFPAAGGTASWQCLGLNSGNSSVVGSASQDAPLIVTISASPTTIVPGASTTLSWNNGSGTCTASASPLNVSWSGVKATSGSISVSPTSTTTYIITCGNGSNQVIVNVRTKPIFIEN